MCARDTIPKGILFINQEDLNEVWVNHLEENDSPTFERNSIKADPFHIQKSYKKTLKKGHGIYVTFSCLLRDAILFPKQEDIERERSRLSDDFFNGSDARFKGNREKSDEEAKKRLYSPSSKVLQGCQRHALPPEILVENLRKVVARCANVKDAKVNYMSSLSDWHRKICITYIFIEFPTDWLYVFLPGDLESPCGRS